MSSCRWPSLRTSLGMKSSRCRSPAGAVVPGKAEVILDEFAVYGTPSQVRDRLTAWDGAVDIVMIGCPSGLPWESLAAAVRAAAP